MPEETRKYIKKTTNTIIFGTLNPNPDVPSLTKYSFSAEDADEMIAQIYDKTDDYKRLLIESMSDVTRIFKPTYYFRVIDNLMYQGREVQVTEHSLIKRDGFIPIEVTRESLCFKIVDSGGKLEVKKLKEDIRRSLRKGLADYATLVKRMRTGKVNEELIRNQLNLRRDFAMRLTEPVSLYLLAAKATRDYQPASDQDALNSTIDNIQTGNSGMVLVPDPETFDVKLEPIKSTQNGSPEQVHVEARQRSTSAESMWKLKNDITYQAAQHLPLLIEHVNEDDELSKEEKATAIGAMANSGVLLEVSANTNIENSKTQKLILNESKKALEAHPKLLLPELSSGDESNTSIVLKKGKKEDGAAYVRKINRQVIKMRQEMPTDALRGNVETIRKYAVATFDGQPEALNSITKYLDTISPEGLLETELQKLGEASDRLLKGIEGEKLYFRLCIEEAAQKSELVNKLRELLFNAVFDVTSTVRPEDEKKIKSYHDRVMDVAAAAFQDYMETLMPLITRLKGINDYLSLVASIKDESRKPDILIANCDPDDVIEPGDDQSEAIYHKLLDELNRPERQEFERAISIVIAPELNEVTADPFFKISFDSGAIVFFGNEGDAISYSDLKQSKVDDLVARWSQSAEHYKSGVLCIPDRIQLPAGFEFILGKSLESGTHYKHHISSSVAVRSCYSIGGLVVRNDDPRFVASTLDIDIKKANKKWPSINVFAGTLSPIQTLPFASEGVSPRIQERDSLPLCIVTHAVAPDPKTKEGRPKDLQIATMHVLWANEDEEPTTISEYRLSKYLTRHFELNPSDKNETLKNLNKEFTDGRRFNTLLKEDIFKLEAENNSTFLRSTKPNSQIVRHLLFSKAPASSSGAQP